jgi:hypothetical protein
MLVLVAAGQLPPGVFLHANTGDDSEDPRTVAYLADVAAPFAERHGIELVVLQPRESLLARLERTDGDLIPWMISPENRGTRACTVEWKLRRIGAELLARGASPQDPATVCLGISTDELSRANTARQQPYERITYPLLGMDLEAPEVRLSRADCMAVIARAGLPVPPKSACWFCPFRSREAWAEMRRDRPELFDRAVALESAKSARAVERGRRPLTLLRTYRPLHTLPPAPDTLFGDDGCDDNAGCWL